MTARSFIAYYRVSTDKQGVSGLGLEAQREAVKRYVGQGGDLLAEFTEIESGKSHINRPQLHAAMQECERRKATLLIAKLDRLARNVHFITGLIESKVRFICCDNPYADTPTLQASRVSSGAHLTSDWVLSVVSQTRQRT